MKKELTKPSGMRGERSSVRKGNWIRRKMDPDHESERGKTVLGSCGKEMAAFK